jgi:hypothetical protein
MTVVLTGLTERQRQSWLLLLDAAADFPNGWCLAGGQMVHQYCPEPGSRPPAPPTMATWCWTCERNPTCHAT